MTDELENTDKELDEIMYELMLHELTCGDLSHGHGVGIVDWNITNGGSENGQTEL